jgi:peptidylprolyl isomerase
MSKKLSILIFIMFLGIALSGCSNPEPKRIDYQNNNNNNNNNMTKENMTNRDILEEYSQAEFKTSEGDFTISFFNEQMPETVANFLNLAKSGYFDNTKFHRVISDFMIQGGDPLSKDDSNSAMWGTGGPGYAIEDEHVAGLSNLRGTISMANSGPNSGGSQFFINVQDNINLDFDKKPETSKHPVFGEVVSGMEVVDKISKVSTDVMDRPEEVIVVEKVNLMK